MPLPVLVVRFKFVGFYSGDHGDGHPFDGPLGTLAHSLVPLCNIKAIDLIHAASDRDFAVSWVIGSRCNIPKVSSQVLNFSLSFSSQQEELNSEARTRIYLDSAMHRLFPPLSRAWERNFFNALMPSIDGDLRAASSNLET